MTLKHLQEAADAIQAHNQAKAGYDAARLEARSKYKDQYLSEALSAINTETSATEAQIKSALKAAQEKITADVTRRYEDIKQLGAKTYLNPDKISPDYKLLDLPTTLTGAELQALHDRNWQDEMFVRALKDYEKAHLGQAKVKCENIYEKSLTQIGDQFATIAAYMNSPATAGMLDNPQFLGMIDNELAAIDATTRETYIKTLGEHGTGAE